MRKPSLLVVFLTVFIDLVGFGIVLPLLPRYSERFGAEGWKIGAIIASFSVMQLFLAPWWGRLSDRIGRRPVLLISNGGSAVAYGMFALAAAPWWSAGQALAWLLASRIFAGACGANIAVAAAYIADITPPEKRSRGMGLIGVAFGLGFILGPAIGAFSAAALGLAGPGWVAAGLCTTNFVLAWAILVESRPADLRPGQERPRLRQIGHTLRLPRVGLLVGLYFLSTFCFAVFETTLPLLLGAPGFELDERSLGYVFAYCGLISAFIQGGVIGRLVRRWGEARLIVGSLIVFGAGMALLPYAAGLGWLLVVLAVVSVGSALNRAPTLGLVSIFSPADEQGASLGVTQSAGTLARIVGPVVATTLYAASPHSPHFLAAGAAFLAAGWAWWGLPERGAGPSKAGGVVP